MLRFSFASFFNYSFIALDFGLVLQSFIQRYTYFIFLLISDLRWQPGAEISFDQAILSALREYATTALLIESLQAFIMLSQTSWTSLTLALTLLLQSADAAVMPPKQKAITGPLLKENLADPSIVKAKDGYYAFATEHHKPSKASRQGADNHVSRADDPNSEKKTNHTINISMAHSQQLDSGWKSVEGSAIHRLPKWAEHPDAQIWGPDVSQLVSPLTAAQRLKLPSLC